MEAELKSLISDRGLVKAALTRFKTFFSESRSSTPISSLKKRLEANTHLYEKFDKIQSRIDQLVVGTDAEISQTMERNQFEGSYFDLIAEVEDYIEEACGSRNRIGTLVGHSVSPSTQHDPLPAVTLPTIQLPSFDGSYGDWIKFRDTFVSLIHSNEALTRIQKFHYLNSALKGPAARVIQSLGVSDLNYQSAWEAVTARFEKPNALKRHHVNALLDLPSPQKHSESSICEFRDDATNHLTALRSLNVNVESWDPLIVPLLSRKLDVVASKEWERRTATSVEEITFKKFVEFLDERSSYLGNVAGSNQAAGMKESQVQNSCSRKPWRMTSHVVNSTPNCSICQSDHALATCEKFKKMNVAERTKHIQDSQRCFNCLQTGHRVRNCTRNHCKLCKRKHHSLLHRDDIHSQKSEKETVEPKVALSCASESPFESVQHTVLSTAIVFVKDSSGRNHKCRILLDSGSQVNFITQAFSKKIGLKLYPFETKISLLGSLVQLIKGRCEIRIQSTYNSFQTKIPCYSVEKITEDMPNVPLERSAIAIPPNIVLADPQFDRTREIDMLIGAGLFWKVLCVGQQRAGSHLTWQKTQFGWVLGGTLTWPKVSNPILSRCHLVTDGQLQSQLEKFWKIEDVDVKIKEELDECEIHFKKNARRDNRGRYIVRIPFLEKISQLGESRDQAEKRLRALERRFEKQPELRVQYIAFMREYEELEHMTRISRSKDDRPAYFLPHHAVSKDTSTTTKTRVVFDGSAKSTTGLSLNDTQRIGPTVQSDLLSILLRFRTRRYVLAADITKMYRQILVDQADRRYQRVLWRESADQPICTFELNTVTYGTASAPFLATRVLRQVGLDNSKEFPDTSNIIINDFYVDDLLTGAETPSEIKGLRIELSNILDQAGFPLRKWATNCPSAFDDNPHVENNKELAAEKDPKTLGLIWSPTADSLQWTVALPETKRVTKRIILSEIAKIFDPLGLVGPIITQAKIIMQKLWQLRTGWDESLSQELYIEWMQYRSELERLVHLRVPRCSILSKHVRIEVHGFSDASEKAYGACIYLRSAVGPGQWEVRLLCAKSRVAPLRSISVPRLELCGSLLLARLIKKVRESLTLTITSETYWTDSTIVIAWLSSPPNKWKTFVANRVAEIQELTIKENWRHVISSENPADIISRGTTPNILKGSNLWWSGPIWLAKDASHWPLSKNSVTEIPEARVTKVSLSVSIPNRYKMFDKYSSYTRLLRVVAYCLRFIDRIRKHKTPNLDKKLDQISLTLSEVNCAKEKIVELVQRDAFHEELLKLKRNELVAKNSALYSLSPFLDSKGLIRVGGRLENAVISYNKKHPLILPAKHPFTDLVIRSEHLRLLHAGCQQVLASLRESVWPINAKSNAKRIIRSCVRCFRVKPLSIETVMGQLPASRVTPARPFMTCGVDYAGPFLTKERTRSKVVVKAYLCLFVCFVTKAVHLELATDLSTEAFLNCFRRFIARRGRCKCIISDNGTNFIGARNELRELKVLLNDEKYNSKLARALMDEGIEWRLIPPQAPHFGGLWEGAVKSAKYHLKRVIGEQRLTFEELYTLLTQVESCMNSRPISPLSSDPNDISPLTPGHLLIGDALCAFPDRDLRDIPTNRLGRYQLIQQLFQHFWQRWQKEYLHQMQQKHKWLSTPQQQPIEGSLVILKEDNAPPLRWSLGRIIKTHQGADGVTRVVTVRTADATYKRPISKLCILPIEDNENCNLHET